MSNYNMLATYVKANQGALKKARGEWRHLRCPLCGDEGTHLGVSMRTGHIVCLRCGAASHATWISKSAILHVEKKEVPKFNEYYVWGGSKNPVDMNIASYINVRGLDILDNQVGFGRGPAWGSVVFIQYDEYEHANYIQWRSIAEKRYMTLPGTSPRLNHYGKRKVEGDILVVTEGPVDAIRVRMATGLWSSPLCSTKLDANYVIDIVQAQPKLVIIMLDNDDAGAEGMYKVAGKLHAMGVDQRVVMYPKNFGPKDAGEMTDEQIVQIISNTLTLE